MNSIIVVVDTNILVSGLLGSRTCRRVFSLFKEGTIQLATSPFLFDEFQFLIHRPKFLILIDPEEKTALINFIKYNAFFVNPKERIHICRDIKDNLILETALCSKAKIIVTGDKDLLVLSPFNGIEILPPHTFLKSLRK